MSEFNNDFGHGCPCRGCKDRVPEPRCHMTCERYKAWRAYLDERKKIEREHHSKHDLISDVKRRKMWQNKRYSRQVHYNKINKT